MATVTKNMAPAIPVPPPKVESYTLELSPDEALLIRSLIGACNSTDPNVTELYGALVGAGIRLSGAANPITIDLAKMRMQYGDC